MKSTVESMVNNTDRGQDASEQAVNLTFLLDILPWLTYM